MIIRLIGILFLPVILLFYTTTFAEIVLDGTLGPAIALQGPDFDIRADLGQQYGGNLFHSFKLFNLNTQEIATFSGPNSVKNIISRVTGGRSIIDGQLRSNIPQADLYLINPNGFVFGENAQLDLQASLHISTATQLHLGDSGVFDTRHPENSILVTAPPSAFGFLDKNPASIDIQGSTLVTQTGQTLSLLGGELKINDGRLRAISGRINLAAVTYDEQFNMTTDILSVRNPATLGKISIENGSRVDIGKQGAGDIYIRGNQFFLDDSGIIANSEIDKNRGLIAIEVNELHMTNLADIGSRALGPGQGGEIFIKVLGQASLSGDSQISSSSHGTKAGAGDAGNISLSVERLDLFDSTISTSTMGPGRGGNITIQATEEINLFSTEFSSAIQARSESQEVEPQNAGHAGRIKMSAKNLSLIGQNSTIDNSTKGAGQGGSISLDIAEQLRLTDQALILADSKGVGNAGSIYINTTFLDMNNGTISTAADKADGGNIIVNARSQLNMTNNSLLSATVSGGQGNGGNLAISNPHFFKLQQSAIKANANEGNGGLVLLISGHHAIKSDDSLITASSEKGVAGEVKIDNIDNVDIGTLPVEFLDASVLIKQHCTDWTDRESSSFFITGRGGLPNAPDDLQSYIPISKLEFDGLSDSVD
jgi:filamentous hemagglutinin family protein